jgi:hypothetical protein
MHIICSTVLITSSPGILNYAKTGTEGNFRLSTAGPPEIRTAHVIIQPQKLHSQLVGARDSCDVPSSRFNVQFRLRHGCTTGGRHAQ